MKKYALFKIKEGKKELWTNWCNELMNRKDEVLLTLQEENLISERYIILDDYVFGEYEIAEGKEKLPMNKERELNKKHYEIFHECLEWTSDAEAGYEFIM